MKKRTAIIGALVSLLPLGQPLVIGTGAALTSAATILAIPEGAKAESVNFLYERGNRRQESGDYYGAIADYTRAIEINPRYANAYNNRGNTKYELEDYYGAIADYTRAIEINPRYDKAYYNRAISKRKLEDYYGAIADYTRAIEINPRYVDAYYNRGFAKKNLGDMQGACADWREASYLGDKDAAKLARNQCQ